MQKKGVARAAAALTVLATLWTAACGGHSAPPKADAEALLQQAKATVDAAQSAHFVLTSQGATGGGTNITGGEGDLARPDQLQGTFTVSLHGLSAHVKVVSKGGVFVAQLPFASKYTRTNPTAFGLTDPSQLLNPDHGLSSLLTAGTNPQVTGQERVAGELLYEVTSTVPGSAIPVLPVIAGAVAGVLGLLAAFTFSAGISDASTHPERFGATWQLSAFYGLNGRDFGPAAQVSRAVAAQPEVTGFLDVRVGGGKANGLTVESYDYDPVDGKTMPVVLTSGAMPASPSQVVLAPTTAASLHARLGSVFTFTGGPAPRAMTVTGIGFVPTGPHNGDDEGAWMTPAGWDRVFSGAHYGFKFHTALVALRPGIDPETAAQALSATAGSVPGGRAFPFGPAQSPGTQQGLTDLQQLPNSLGWFLALLAVVAVGYALVTTVRRRSHELAVLRALGLTSGADGPGHHHPRQLAGAGRAGGRHPARPAGRSGGLADRGRLDPAGLPAAVRPVAVRPRRAGRPGDREPAGPVARVAGRPVAPGPGAADRVARRVAAGRSVRARPDGGRFLPVWPSPESR